MGCQGCKRRKQKIKAFFNEYALHSFSPPGSSEQDMRIQFLDGNRLFIGRDVAYRTRMRLIDQYGGTYTIVDDPDTGQ